MKVRIYEPAKSAMQSGRAGNPWILEYETTSAREPEALMGWTCSGDTLNQVRLRFETMEKAVAFAREKGWTCDVQTHQERKVRPRNYGDNFRIPPVDAAWTG